jgi:hypothetical protein
LRFFFYLFWTNYTKFVYLLKLRTYYKHQARLNKQILLWYTRRERPLSLVVIALLMEVSVRFLRAYKRYKFIGFLITVSIYKSYIGIYNVALPQVLLRPPGKPSSLILTYPINNKLTHR